VATFQTLWSGHLLIRVMPLSEIGKSCMADTLDAAIKLVAAVSCGPDTFSSDKFIITLWRLALCSPVLQGELDFSYIRMHEEFNH
jgi:hypothetical protein